MPLAVSNSSVRATPKLARICRENLRLPVRPRLLPLHHFAVIVDKTDRAEGQHGEHGEPHVGILEIAPKQRGNHGRAYDQNAAHRRRSGLGLMALRALFADELADLHFAQPPDHPGTKHQRDQQRRKARQRRAHRDVAKHIERVKIALQHVIEEVESISAALLDCGARSRGAVDSSAGNRASSASTMRSIFTPREPFTSRRSPGSIKSATNSRGFRGDAKKFARVCRMACFDRAANKTFGIALHADNPVEFPVPRGRAPGFAMQFAATKAQVRAFLRRRECAGPDAGVCASSSIIAASATGFEL